MSYIPRQILDRVASDDDLFELRRVGTSTTYQLIPQPTAVAEPGTDINKALLQPLEDSMADFKNQALPVNGATSELENIEIVAGSVVNNTSGWFTVTLPKELSVIPAVSVVIDQNAHTDIYIAQVQNITKTSFQVCVRKFTAVTNSYYVAYNQFNSANHYQAPLVDAVSYATTTDDVKINWLAIADNSYDI